MLKTVEGIYQNGQIELAEIPDDLREARVIVTFLPKSDTSQSSTHEMSEAQAFDLRTRLRTFEEDWNHPGMDIYDKL